jgi:hypothetical protein
MFYGGFVCLPAPTSVQQMAKSANSKVIFVPMQLQSDVVSQLANQQGETSVAGGSSNDVTVGLSGTGRAAVLNSISEV